MAKARGKNPYLWFFLGMFFGVFGLLFLYLSSRAKGAAQRKAEGPTTIDITPQFDPAHSEKLWYYLEPDNQQKGPMSFNALAEAFRDGKVSNKTFVWNETLENWKPFAEFLPK